MEYEMTPFYCPVCGEEVYEVVYKRDGIIIGCDQCIDETEFWEEEDYDPEG